MKCNKWWTFLACAGVVTAVIASAAIAAGTQGSQDDPLVTLSYLNEVALPQIMERVEAHVKERTDQLKEESGGAGAAFRVVELKQGELLRPSAGCQFLIRSGTLESTNALVDLTTGETWANNGSLLANHLYIATGDEQAVTAAGDSILMVQGSCKTE